MLIVLLPNFQDDRYTNPYRSLEGRYQIQIPLQLVSKASG